MKTIKILGIIFFALALNIQVNAANEIKKEKKTAESVFTFASSMEQFDSELFKLEIKDLSFPQKVKLVKISIADVKQAQLLGNNNPSVGLYVLAVLIPPLAVGIYTHWGMPTFYNLLWTLCGDIPGIIHAFIVLSR